MTTTDGDFPKIDRAHSVALNRNCWTDDPAISDLVTRLAEEMKISDLEKKGNKKPKLTATGMLLILVTDLYSNWKLDPTQSIGFSKNNNSYKVKSRYNKAGVSPQIIEIVKRMVEYGYLDEVKGHWSAPTEVVHQLGYDDPTFWRTRRWLESERSRKTLF